MPRRNRPVVKVGGGKILMIIKFNNTRVKKIVTRKIRMKENKDLKSLRPLILL